MIWYMLIHDLVHVDTCWYVLEHVGKCWHVLAHGTLVHSIHRSHIVCSLLALILREDF